MSTRNIRKHAKRLELASLKSQEAANVEAEDDFEPLYVEKVTSSYAALAVSSSSEDLANASDYLDDEEATASGSLEIPKTGNKKNRKKNKRGKVKPGVSNDTANSQPDEIARIVAEVNEIMGSPEPAELIPEPPQPKNDSLLKINHQDLNPEIEFTRRFGSDEEDIKNRRARRAPARLPWRHIVPKPNNYNISIRGLSMKLVEVKDGVKFYKFEHSREYETALHILYGIMKLEFANANIVADHELLQSDTVESLIQNLDLYFQIDEQRLAINILEHAIYALQSAFDPMFNYVDGKTRLEYRFVENRTFHIVLLKYLHILSNKGCHRTALEIAKLMLNLDPNDPLGVIFIMDTMAIRAREHKWLVDIYNHWAQEKHANRLFNVQYSLALAMFHLYLQSKTTEDLHAANNKIKEAMAMYPNVAVMLMKRCYQENKDITNHEMFTTNPNSTTCADLLNLQSLYVAFIWEKWRESSIMEWLTKNALEMLANDPATKASFEKGAEDRSRLFRKYPLEIKRYLHTISSMSMMLVDGAVPSIAKTIAFNPYPLQGYYVDHYRYYRNWVAAPVRERGNVFTQFYGSLVPDRVDRANDGPENHQG